ncbi:MAG: type II secretion system protein [Actinomycetota bacterium]
MRGASSSADDGFTLPEVMVVVFVIGILLAVGIPTYLGAQDRAHDRAAQTKLNDALVTATVVFVDELDFFDADAAGLALSEPALAFVASPAESTDDATLSVAPAADGRAWGAAIRSDSGTCFYLRSSGAGPRTFGASDTFACTGDFALTASAADWSGETALGASGLESGFAPVTNTGSWNTTGAGAVYGDWEVVSGNVDFHHNNLSVVALPTTHQVIDLNGTTAGHIRRSVTIAPNRTYQLSLEVAENVWGGPAVKQMEIIWNGDVVETVDIDMAANAIETRTFDLPPSSTREATLEFRSLHGSAHGPLIANPQVT